MKTRILLLPFIGLLAAVIGLQAAESTTTPLEDTMDEINAAYRKLNRQISDATKNADSLKQVAAMQKHANDAMKMEPVKKKELPAAEQAKFIADYQAKMKSFVGNIGKVETALKAGKNDEAAVALKALKQDQDEGHKTFKKDKKKKTEEKK
jgi:soluble cytochrome b562